MKFSVTALFAAACLSSVNGMAIEQRGGSYGGGNGGAVGNSFAGSNLYFLHGLSDKDQDYYINTLAEYGAKTVRIWATGLGKGCQKGSNVARDVNDLESELGKFDNDVLKALDVVLAKLVKKGMKAIISPHDGNAFGYNSCDVYAKKYGSCGKNDAASGKFYTDKQAMADYDKRMAHVLNFKSPSSGKAWSQWSEAILAFDIQNEPFQQGQDHASGNDKAGWMCGRATAMKKLIGGSGVKLATGGIGGDQSHGNNLMPAALACPALDIISVHGYVSTAGFWSGFLPKSVDTCRQHGKLLHVEEWGVSKSYSDSFDKQAAAITAAGVPYTYWQMVPGPDGSGGCYGGCCSGFDGFEVSLKNTQKGDAQKAIRAAAAKKATQARWAQQQPATPAKGKGVYRGGPGPAKKPGKGQNEGGKKNY